MRKQDAVPDELEIVPEGRLSKRNSSSSLAPPLSPGGTPAVPLTVVEKVDLNSPSHGEVPGTAAYEKRQADAAPDLVLKASDSNKVTQTFSPSQSAKPASPGSIPTIVTRAASVPSLDTEPDAAAKGLQANDIMPGIQEHEQSGEGKQ